METFNQVSDKLGNTNGSQREGAATKRIEKVTAALPSSAWLLLAGGSIVASLGFKIFGKSSTANFIGQWAPTFLMIGLYNKVVKVMGSERND